MRFCPGAGLDVPGKSFRASNCWNSLRGKYRNKCIGLIFHWTDVSLERTAPHTTHLAGKSIGDWWGQSDSDCQLAMYLQSKQMHQKLILYKACFWFVLFFFLFFLADLGCALLLSYKKREHFYRSLQHAAAIIIGEPQVVWLMVFNVNHWGSVGRDYTKYKTFYRIVLQYFSSSFGAGLLHLSHCPKMTFLYACLLKSSLTIFKQLQKILMAVLMRVNHCWEQGAHQDGFLSWWGLAECCGSSWYFSGDWYWVGIDTLGRCWLIWRFGGALDLYWLRTYSSNSILKYFFYPGHIIYRWYLNACVPLWGCISKISREQEDMFNAAAIVKVPATGFTATLFQSKLQQAWLATPHWALQWERWRRHAGCTHPCNCPGSRDGEWLV